MESIRKTIQNINVFIQKQQAATSGEKLKVPIRVKRGTQVYTRMQTRSPLTQPGYFNEFETRPEAELEAQKLRNKGHEVKISTKQTPAGLRFRVWIVKKEERV